MNNDLWARLEDLYHRALEQPQPTRSDFLDRECGGEAELRREIERLLAHESKEEGFLEESALETEARRLADHAADSWIGKRAGNYEFLSLLGAGGMAEVYRARDSKLQRDVAIKVLPATFADDAERVQRFEQEARTLASLSHPNIGAIYGWEDADGRYALILELVEGATLAERLETGPIPIPEAIRIAEQIAAGLRAAYEKGITHRDLKPANIKIAAGGIVKLLDFGLAKAFAIDKQNAGSSLATMEGVILGTPAYMSPEQARGQNVDHLTDIWAFGCVLYQMLAGCSSLFRQYRFGHDRGGTDPGAGLGRAAF